MLPKLSAPHHLEEGFLTFFDMDPIGGLMKITNPLAQKYISVHKIKYVGKDCIKKDTNHSFQNIRK
jgi:hypothetical protein